MSGAAKGAREEWDLEETAALRAAAERWLKRSKRYLVLIVGPEDVAFAVHPDVAAKDVRGMVDACWDELELVVSTQREELRKGQALKDVRAGFER